MAAAESSNPVDLPRFSERLANLRIILQNTISSWENCSPKDSYLPALEKIHQEIHSLKGILKILSASADEQFYIESANELIRAAVRGEMIIPHPGQAIESLQFWLSSIPENTELPTNVEIIFQKIRANYVADQNHNERLLKIGTSIPYIDEIVSKRWRECERNNYKMQIWEQDCKLSELPKVKKDWEAKIGRGFIINFLPLVSAEGSSQIHLKVWVALR